MPTLTRLIGWLALIAALGFGLIVAFATLVEPEQAEMTIRIPANRLNSPQEGNGD